jgi:DNA-binding Lrp family transcriptional regulator
MKDFDVVMDERIKAFVDELQAIVRNAAVEAVSDALGVSKAAAARPFRRATKRAGATKRVVKEGLPRSKGGRRTTRQLGLIAARLRKHVEGSPGQTIVEISKALKASHRELTRPMSKLLAEGAVKKTGQRRQTRYWAGSASPQATKRAAPRRGGKRPRGRGKKK